MNQPVYTGAVARLLDPGARLLDPDVFRQAGADMLLPANLSLFDTQSDLARVLRRAEQSGESCVKALRRGLLNQLFKVSISRAGRFDPRIPLALGLESEGFKRVLGADLASGVLLFVDEVYGLKDRSLCFASRGSALVGPETYKQIDTLVWRSLDDPGVFTRMAAVYRAARTETALVALSSVDRCYVVKE